MPKYDAFDLDLQSVLENDNKDAIVQAYATYACSPSDSFSARPGCKPNPCCY